jgi:hypothetical protein
MISLQGEEMNLLALAPNSLRVALDFLLLRTESLLELHLVALTVAETPRGIAVGLALLRLCRGTRFQV